MDIRLVSSGRVEGSPSAHLDVLDSPMGQKWDHRYMHKSYVEFAVFNRM